jgi:uncharacterized protein (TIGR02118 family)
MIKMIALLKRRTELSHDAFIEHWVNTHAALAEGVPGLRRYVQSHILTEPTRADVRELAVDIDGIAELWFDDAESMNAVHHTPEMQRLLADGATFIGEIKTFIVDERDVNLIPTAR